MPTLLTRPTIDNDLSRRDLLAALAAAGLLTACAGPAPAGTDTAPATKPFTHALGTTEVPVAPQRIVALGSTFTTWQLATLGVYAIATSSASPADPTQYIRLADPAAADALDGIVSVDNGSGDLVIEQIAALAPDLIVGGDFQSDFYEELSAIAPTVLIATDLPNDRFYGVQRTLADLTGTLPELERLHDEYDARVAALRERYADRWASLEWLVLDEISGDEVVGLVNLSDDGPANRVLTDLGAPLAPAAARYTDDASAARFGYVEISKELVTGLEADVVFVAPPYTDLVSDPATPISPDLLDLLGATTAARTGRIRPVGLAWTNTNVASLMTVLDDLERFLGPEPEAFLTAGG